jgi:diaminopimelate epimerase
MDYRNADGSLSQMCGNGVRVMALYLATHADVDLRNQLLIATRGGIKRIDFDGANITVDMGEPVVKGESNVGVGAKSWSSRHVDMGNPHAVAFVESLEDAGDLREAPQYDESVYPEGVNIEFVTRVGDHHVAMRVHERGVGETRSCGTGACAAGVVAALVDGAERGETYVVDVPGGVLEVTWTAEDRVLLSGPAVLVAEGTVDL